MRWMFCCMWLACCSLDTNANSSSGGTSTKSSAPKAEWTPRDTSSGRASTASSEVADASAPAQAARSDASSAKNLDAGPHASPKKDKPKPALDAALPPTMPAAPDAADTASAALVDASTAAMAGTAGSVAKDAAADAAIAADGGDAAQVDNLLVWFALTGTRQQRLLMAALIADLEGRHAIDEDGMVSVLRNFDELQCRRNVQLCWQVCIWATSRCNVCEGWECQRLMYQHCGSDCRSDP